MWKAYFANQYHLYIGMSWERLKVEDLVSMENKERDDEFST